METHMKHFKTKAGTELPLLDLRGKDYLQVAHRLVWFREEHPDWSITTEYVQLSENHAIAKAVVSNERGLIIATSHKCEDRKGFADFIEKAETGAIGRALAACGYGTQFAPELDEEHRIVDSPLNRMPQRATTQKHRVAATNTADLKQTTTQVSTGPTKPSQAQLKRLFTLADAANWQEEDIRAYLKSMGMESTKELNYFQYEAMCKKIQDYPMLVQK